MNCPVCQDVTLAIASREGIEIDHCPRCRGVWLDRGELDKIVERSLAFASTERAVDRDRDRRDDDRDRDRDRRDDDRDRDRDRDRRYDDRDRRDDDYSKRKKRRSFFEEIFDFD